MGVRQGWVVVTLQYADQYSSETSWLITDETGMVGEESPGVIYSNSFNQNTVFLPPGNYTFTIYDSFEDVWYLLWFKLDLNGPHPPECMRCRHSVYDFRNCRTNHTI